MFLLNRKPLLMGRYVSVDSKQQTTCDGVADCLLAS